MKPVSLYAAECAKARLGDKPQAVYVAPDKYRKAWGFCLTPKPAARLCGVYTSEIDMRDLRDDALAAISA